MPKRINIIGNKLRIIARDNNNVYIEFNIANQIGDNVYLKNDNGYAIVKYDSIKRDIAGNYFVYTGEARAI